MKRAADFRAEARAALKGRWGLAIGIGFLAMVLGGIAGVGGLDVNFVMVEGNFQMTLDIFGQRLNPVEMMRNIGVGSAFLVWQYLSVAAALVAIVRLIVGSFVGVGYMKFNLDLIDNAVSLCQTVGNDACGCFIAGGVYHRLDAAVYHSGTYCGISLSADRLYSGGKPRNGCK